MHNNHYCSHYKRKKHQFLGSPTCSSWKNSWWSFNNLTGLYKVEHPPPRIKPKGLEMGKKIKGWRRRKTTILEDFTLLTVPKDSIWLIQHYFTLFWQYSCYIYTLYDRKSNNFSTGRRRKLKKSKAAIHPCNLVCSLLKEQAKLFENYDYFSN